MSSLYLLSPKPSTPPLISLLSVDDLASYVLLRKWKHLEDNFHKLPPPQLSTHLYLHLPFLPLIIQHEFTMLLSKANPSLLHDWLLSLFHIIISPPLLDHSYKPANQNKTEPSLTPCLLLNFILLNIAKYSKEFYFILDYICFSRISSLEPI